MSIVFQGLIRALEESGIPIDQIGGRTVSHKWLILLMSAQVRVLEVLSADSMQGKAI